MMTEQRSRSRVLDDLSCMSSASAGELYFKIFEGWETKKVPKGEGEEYYVNEDTQGLYLASQIFEIGKGRLKGIKEEEELKGRTLKGILWLSGWTLLGKLNFRQWPLSLICHPYPSPIAVEGVEEYLGYVEEMKGLFDKIVPLILFFKEPIDKEGIIDLEDQTSKDLWEGVHKILTKVKVFTDFCSDAAQDELADNEIPYENVLQDSLLKAVDIHYYDPKAQRIWYSDFQKLWNVWIFITASWVEVGLMFTILLSKPHGVESMEEGCGGRSFFRTSLLEIELEIQDAQVKYSLIMQKAEERLKKLTLIQEKFSPRNHVRKGFLALKESLLTINVLITAFDFPREEEDEGYSELLEEEVVGKIQELKSWSERSVGEMDCLLVGLQNLMNARKNKEKMGQPQPVIEDEENEEDEDDASSNSSPSVSPPACQEEGVEIYESKPAFDIPNGDDGGELFVGLGLELLEGAGVKGEWEDVNSNEEEKPDPQLVQLRMNQSAVMCELKVQIDPIKKRFEDLEEDARRSKGGNEDNNEVELEIEEGGNQGDGQEKVLQDLQGSGENVNLPENPKDLEEDDCWSPPIPKPRRVVNVVSISNCSGLDRADDEEDPNSYDRLEFMPERFQTLADALKNAPSILKLAPCEEFVSEGVEEEDGNEEQQQSESE